MSESEGVDDVEADDEEEVEGPGVLAVVIVGRDGEEGVCHWRREGAGGYGVGE